MSPSPIPSGANRARGTIETSFRRVGDRTEIVGPYETGGYRLRVPRSRDEACEAVIVNTGGGMAGGDRATFRFAAGLGATATVTTTAAEKIYRAEAEAARVDVAIALSEGATFEWLPQETILFDGGRLERTLAVDMAPGADLLLAETLVFGRLAMGERLISGGLHDRWRIRRGGRLALAEELRIEGEMTASLDRAAIGAGARAAATIVLMAPRAEALLDAAREVLDGYGADVSAGASAWEGRLVVRALSASPARLRGAVAAALTAIRGRPLPRLWG